MVEDYTGDYNSVIDIKGDVFLDLINDINKLVATARRGSGEIDRDLLTRWKKVIWESR